MSEEAYLMNDELRNFLEDVLEFECPVKKLKRLEELTQKLPKITSFDLSPFKEKPHDSSPFIGLNTGKSK